MALSEADHALETNPGVYHGYLQEPHPKDLVDAIQLGMGK